MGKRYYILSEWCNRHGVDVHRDGDDYNSGFIFSYNGLDFHYDFYDVIDRPDVIRDRLKQDFKIR